MATHIFKYGDDEEYETPVAMRFAPRDVSIREAKLTLKRDWTDQAFAFQRIIRLTADPSQGEVVDGGLGGGGVPGVGRRGELLFALPRADTLSLELRDYVYDIQVELTNGKLTTVDEGIFRWTRQITS